jgi:glycosyltransferase involved in cell wall biosynthesis
LNCNYEQAIAAIVPSIGFETFGNVLIEAFRAGVPVMARRLGPFPEIVELAQGGELFSTPERSFW